MNKAYLAGVVDSDGSISINKQNNINKKNGYRPLFQLTWRDTPECSVVIKELLKEYGGSIHKQHGSNLSPNNTFIHYSLTGADLKVFLEDIKPHILIKRKQLNVCYELVQLKFKMNRFGHGLPKSMKLYKKEIQLHKRLIKLNSSGKSPKNKRRSEAKTND